MKTVLPLAGKRTAAARVAARGVGAGIGAVGTGLAAPLSPS